MKWLKRIGIALIVLFVGIQAVRPDLTNPPVHPAESIAATGMVTPQVARTLERSCYDCHSHQTAWPWYSQIAPVSWWLNDHVREARSHLNFSRFATYEPKKQEHKLEEICHEIKEGEMPLESYLPLHPRARLSDADRQALCQWTDQQRAMLKAKFDIEPGNKGSQGAPGAGL